jgi:hypothetical protein
MSFKLKELFDFAAIRLAKKKGGPKMKVSPTMLLKANGEKMSVCGFAKMLLKKHEL